MKAAFEDSVFLASHVSCLMKGAADIAFRMETQKIANFLLGS